MNVINEETNLYIMGGVMFILMGCSSRLAELDKYTSVENSETEKTLKTIIDALDNKDAELLKSVLSKEALDSDDLDIGINYIFELYEGTSTSVKENACPVHDTFGPEGETKMIDAGYTITTDKGKQYFLDFQYWLIQEVNPDIKGVNKIKLSNNAQEDTNSSYVSTGDYTFAGIYNPAWDEPQNSESE